MREVKLIRKHYEGRIRWEAVIIYIIVIVLLTYMIYYVSNLKKSILNQRVAINHNEMVLNFTNDLIQNVNEAQAQAQLYTVSGKRANLRNFNKYLKNTIALKDSIVFYSDDDTENKKILNDIIGLLNRKEVIIKEITHQYDLFNPYDEISKIITDYRPQEKTTKIVAVTKQDTIFRFADRQTFFQRLFNSDIPRDSIILVTTTTYDTITEEVPENRIDLMEGIKIYTEKGKEE